MSDTTESLPSRVANHQDAIGAPARLSAAAAALSAAHPERGDLCADLMACAVAGEHLAVLGPPGTAKSLIARRFAAMFTASYFEYLLTPFTEPAELYGPVDVASFKLGVQRRVVTGMLPDVEFAFLDEAFKGSSAILNTMLALLNERVFHQGAKALQVPLQSAVLASNEMPPSGTSALWDRCLVRHTVRYLQHEENRLHLMLGSLPPPPAPGMVSLDDVQEVRDLAQQVLLPVDVAKALSKLYNNLAAKGIIVSDRRQVQAIGFLRAVAALQGDTEIGDEHIGRLSSVLWERPEQLKEVEKLLEPLAASWRPHVKHFTSLLDGSRAALRTQQARSTPDLQECASILRTTQDMQTAMQAQLRKHAHRPPVAGLFEATKHLLTEVTTLVKKATGVV